MFFRRQDDFPLDRHGNSRSTGLVEEMVPLIVRVDPDPNSEDTKPLYGEGIYRLRDCLRRPRIGL